MKFTCLTLFPDTIRPYFEVGVVSRGAQKNLVSFDFVNLRDFSGTKYGSVDDRSFGGGAGLVIRPEVIVDAVESLVGGDGELAKSMGTKVVLTSPRGRVFDQKVAEEYSRLDHLVIICGRYEGVDQRAIDLVVDEEVSVGDYVLSGGELAAQIIADATARLIPGVIENDEATHSESHTTGLLEYPQFTRPQEFRGLNVPDVLLSGNHANIEKWRQEQSENLTRERRPDLWEKFLKK